MRTSTDLWPELPLQAWEDTRATLHMWTQIVGKIRLALTPLVNHWWNVPLYVSSRGLTTTAIHYQERTFEVVFDFIDHMLAVTDSAGQTKAIPLIPRSVAAFYRELMSTLDAMGIKVEIWPMPVEIPDPIAFDLDESHHSYDPDFANRFWRVLSASEKVMQDFRARFVGKCSPVHFFWGSFDLAVTRFSGRPAPEREGADSITREAYSHEVSSAGFWPGAGSGTDAVYYSYASPEPPRFREAVVRPGPARYSAELGEFLIPYRDVRASRAPEQALMDFLQSTYVAAADLGAWDRTSLER